MTGYEVTLSKHPEIGFGTWWEVANVREDSDPPFGGCWSGYAFTTWGARRRAMRLARNLQKTALRESFIVGGAA